VGSTPSRKATIFEADLVEGLFGRIHLKSDPMRIEINQHVNPTRARICLIHELLHMGEQMLKCELEHVKLHRAAVYLYSFARDDFANGIITRGRAARLIAEAFRTAGLEASEDVMPMWAAFLQKEIVPTMAAYIRRQRSK